jgi:lysocardiolipin and lysophospholipid acyltransferase
MKITLKGFMFLFCCWITAFFASVFLTFPALLTIPFSLTLYRKLCDFIAQLWFIIPISLIEYLYGIKLFFVGDNLNNLLTSKNTPCLMICNHRTRLDWMFLWNFIIRFLSLKNEKIIMKKPLKNIPWFGWGMQHFLFLFLERNWIQDQFYLKNLLNYFIEQEYPIQLLLFPEGTDLCPNSRKRDDAYAEKQGLQKYEKVLHPRIKGWQTIMNLLGNANNNAKIKGVIDITIGYIGTIPQLETSLLSNKLPTSVHFYIKYYPLSSFSLDDKSLEQWLEQKWEEKETILQKFYIDQKFSDKNIISNKNIGFSLCLTILFWILFVIFCFFFYVSIFISKVVFIIC